MRSFLGVTTVKRIRNSLGVFERVKDKSRNKRERGDRNDGDKY